ncbi:MAG TPA: TatD family hydrolase [Bacteroidales bacterium]|nr:TatD family hydrolase [Bacteroidales bacterium]
MHLVDTHNHIYLQEFDADRDDVIGRGVSAGVTSLLLPGIDSSSFKSMIEVAARYKDVCRPMIGLHPTSVNESYKKELDFIHDHLHDKMFYGIGETGIDLYWDKTFINEQLVSFNEHLLIAEKNDLPVVIHARESLEVIFDHITRFGPGKVTGVFHAFPGNAEDARKAVNMGFKIGIGGVVTFRNSKTGEAALAAGIENIVLETDAPYLTPVPFRGKRNESAYLIYTVNKLAELFSMEPEEVAGITTANAIRLFKLN